MIEDNLAKIGLNNKEIAVYLAILKLGKTTPARLSKLTGINRSTVYSVARELLDKGVIAEDLGGKTIYLVALPPENLSNIIKKERRILKKRELLIEDSIEDLLSIASSKKYSVPKIRFVEDEKMEEYLYSQMVIWSESAKNKDNTCWGFQEASFPDKFKEWIKWANDEYQLKVRLFSNQSDVKNDSDLKKMPQRKIVFWEGENNFTSSVWIMGDHVVMIATQEKPYYLVDINDSVLSHNLREFFSGVWEKYHS